jgi:RNA polymerase sigma factor (sigma-70 family)
MATAAPEIPVLARDQAFESLYRRYVKDVYHYSLALLRNPADAEDVTQTTFLNAYRAYQRGIEIEKPQNWLIKIAHNVARTRYARASRRVKEVPLEDHVERLAVPEPEQPDVVGVLRALGRLPFNQRAALVMRELEGRTYAEIADTIGVSVSAVETLIFRARKSLRLKASALRALAVVPLPSSLTQFFEGGGAVAAGGGAAIGTGFLVKAAVALVAGAVATGVGAHQRAATPQAAGSTPRVAAVESRQRADAFMSGPATLSRSTKGARIATQGSVRPGAATAAVGTKPAANVAAQGAVPRQDGPQAGLASSATATATASATATAAPVPVPVAVPAPAPTPTPTPTPQLPNQVSSLAGAVENVGSAVAPSLPVEAPSLPPIDVEVPQVLGGTPLP